MKVYNTHSILVFRSTFLFFVCLFFSLQSIAQNEVVIDSMGTPPTPDEEVVEGIDTTTNEYFYARWDTLSVEQRNIPGKAVKELKEDEDFWYANADIKTKQSNKELVNEKEKGQKGQKGKNEQPIKEQQQSNSYRPMRQSSWGQTLIWIVILAIFIGGLLMYLGGNNIGLFRKKNVLTGDSEKEEEITENIFAINYQKEIDKAAAHGNYRVAIRLMFLRALRNLSEKNIIRYKQDKTNLDYLMELQPTNYYNSFFRITRNFEYSWYGQFNVSEEGYKAIRSDFDQFDKIVK